jgi:hypothetical protein
MEDEKGNRYTIEVSRMDNVQWMRRSLKLSFGR